MSCYNSLEDLFTPPQKKASTISRQNQKQDLCKHYLQYRHVHVINMQPHQTKQPSYFTDSHDLSIGLYKSTISNKKYP